MRRVPRLPLDQLAPYLLGPGVPEDPTRPPPALDWPTVFGNTNPVELEVGFGKGLFLLTESQSRPGVNFVGVEIEKKYVLYTATRLAKRGLPNVKVVAGDARAFLTARIVPGSLQGVHVYFPDPWWKKRHHKRRVFTEGFVASIVRALRPGGFLSVATDVEEYYQLMSELLGKVSELRELPKPEEHTPEHDLDYMTNFERKKRKEGLPIYRARFERVSPPPRSESLP